MKLQLFTTGDGSRTLYRTDLDEHYHSIYGAIGESMHIYINSGLKQVAKSSIKIFELGFGTGLNAILSLIEADKNNCRLLYHSIEKYPLDPGLIRELNHIRYLPSNYHEVYDNMHQAEWNKKVTVGGMSLMKIHDDIRIYDFKFIYDLIYFDPFSPEKDPGLWSPDIFRKMYEALEIGGILVTYSVKGNIRQILVNLGFIVNRIPGPPGKKQILRAIK